MSIVQGFKKKIGKIFTLARTPKHVYTKVITTMALSRPQSKLNLFSQDPVENLDLDAPFFTSHLITYIGNKRRLLPFLYKGFLEIRKN